MSLAAFPALRLRRSRSHDWSRALVAENHLAPADLIWPLFVTEGKGMEEPIKALPGVARWSVDRIADQARLARDLGIPCIALFPNTRQRCAATMRRRRSFRQSSSVGGESGQGRLVPEVGILTAVALDPYTSPT